MEIGRLTVTSEPTELPVSVADAKTQLRLEHDQHDSLIEDQINSAWDYVAEILDRTLLTTTYTLTFDDWPDEIVLRRPPVQSVTSVEYQDTDDQTQTLTAGDDYHVTTDGDTGRIKPHIEWPQAYGYGYDNIKVTYDAGYGSASDIPKAIRQAIISVVIDLYESPGLTLVQNQPANKTVERLLGLYKRYPVL